MEFPNLTTDRLFLRELREDDAEEIFRLRSDPNVNELIGRKPAVTLDDAREFIKRIHANSATREGLMWVITLPGNPKLIGTVVYWPIEWENNKAEIGYEMLPEFRGNGFMQEALQKVIDFGFEELKFKTIVADTKEQNLKSIKLLEKLGFSFTSKNGEYLLYSLCD